ncbi:MAG: NAD(P)/FAD-dependent oxidoreductase [Methanomassiliicoccales archaeon]|jgi:thioredoxin reductase (NADPH)
MDYDLVIIGGGPAGLTAGICAVQRNLRTIIIEAEEAGGQPGTLYPEKEIYNWPCFQSVTGQDISKNFVNNALKKGVILKQNETAEEILDVPNGLRVVTNKGSYSSAAVIIAIGNGFLKPIKLDVPGASELEGKGVHYMMPSKKEFTGKSVVFVGGGNSALEMALMVCNIADTCIVHRRDRFRADHCMIEKVKDAKIRTVMNAEILKIEGRGKVEKVHLKIGDAQEEIAVDMVVIKVGMTPETEHLKRWNLALEGDGIKVNQQMLTSRKGVFACGDAVAYPGKYRQIVTSSSEGATAVNSVVEYFRKQRNLT